MCCKHVLFALNRVKQARPAKNTKRVRHILSASRGEAWELPILAPIPESCVLLSAPTVGSQVRALMQQRSETSLFILQLNC